MVRERIQWLAELKGSGSADRARPLLPGYLVGAFPRCSAAAAEASTSGAAAVAGSSHTAHSGGELRPSFAFSMEGATGDGWIKRMPLTLHVRCGNWVGRIEQIMLG